MAWFGDKQLVDILTIASVLSAAGFGALGLFTDFKKDGKVTRYGRMAVGGIMLSAAFSIAVGLLQDRIEAARTSAAEKKEKIKRDEDRANFETQIQRLEGLNQSLRDVNQTAGLLQDDMRSSLASQGVLLANARQSMLLTAGLGIQERANTGRVLRSMWDDANRIDGASIEIVAGYSCRMKLHVDLPRLLFNGAEAKLGVTPASNLGKGIDETYYDPFAGATFGPGSFKDVRLVREMAPIKLTATPHDFYSSSRLSSPNYGESFDFTILHSMRFGPFLNAKLGALASPDGWRGAAVEIVISAPLPEAEEAIMSRFDGPIGGEEELVRLFPGTKPWWGRKVPPCTAWTTLLVNRRAIASPAAALVVLPTSEGARPATVVLKSRVVLVDPAELPRFASARIAAPRH